MMPYGICGCGMEAAFCFRCAQKVDGAAIVRRWMTRQKMFGRLGPVELQVLERLLEDIA